jgi:hypothetical protein
MLGVNASIIPKKTACIVVISVPTRLILRISCPHAQRASWAFLMSIETRRLRITTVPPRQSPSNTCLGPLFLSDRCGSSTTVNPLLLAPESLAQPGRESGMRLDPVGADPEGVAFEYEVPE